jgi:sec-independent protein translocase protein TatA
VGVVGPAWVRNAHRLRVLFIQGSYFDTSTGGAPMFEGLFQPMHLMIIAGIALLIFGPKKLPELGKGMGEGIRGFKAAMQGKDEAAPTEAERQTRESDAKVG